MTRLFLHSALWIGFAACVLALAPEARAQANGKEPKKVSVASLKPRDLNEFDALPKTVQQLIRNGLDLTGKKLGYTFGSADPKRGGMDCSGTVYHTLQSIGVKPPRSSYDMYQWVKGAGLLREALGVSKLTDPAFSRIKPGDLLFWQGTYDTGGKNPPISHVMIYIGTLKKDGHPVVFGASSGRRYRGKAIHGVSVFDLGLPSPGSKASFVGYGPIPGLDQPRPK